MILRYVSIVLHHKAAYAGGERMYSKLCITDGKFAGEEGDDTSCFTMTLDEFNEHDWDGFLYDDWVATLLYEMPPKLANHYQECCTGHLEWEDGDYCDEYETHACPNCEMRWNVPVELVRDYDNIMPEDSQYEHPGPSGITPLAFLKLLKQPELF